ncbi:MAG: hypothetical protein JSV13_06835 [Nitrospiraceae bacterium]|nr:MAG: hypothetical protein JSV13_06835 [Nitrospiraceae bacterium]
MKKNAIMLGIVLSMLVLAGGCQKKEEEPPPVVPKGVMPGQQVGPSGQQTPPPGHQALKPRGESTIVVPDSVQGKWKGIVLTIENKETQKTEEFTVDLNTDFNLPNSNLKISVGEFMPHFKMEGLTITSASNELTNPAVGIKIFEGDKQIFPVAGKKWGWLYTKFPKIHPFEHPKYGVKLKEGVKKG